MSYADLAHANDVCDDFNITLLYAGDSNFRFKANMTEKKILSMPIVILMRLFRKRRLRIYEPEWSLTIHKLCI